MKKNSHQIVIFFRHVVPRHLDRVKFKTIQGLSPPGGGGGGARAFDHYMASKEMNSIFNKEMALQYFPG